MLFRSFIVFLIVFSLMGYRYSKFAGSVEFCANSQCHSMWRYAQTFYVSPHADANIQCIECHSEARSGPLVSNKYLGELYTLINYMRSEERRGGTECRSRLSPDH